jgi:hypothetical protein
VTRHDQHPWWCARNHSCTAPTGPHRSTSVTFDTPAYRLVATRVRARSGRDQLELRAVIGLPAGPADARNRARALIVAVCLALAPRRMSRRGNT